MSMGVGAVQEVQELRGCPVGGGGESRRVGIAEWRCWDDKRQGMSEGVEF